MADAKQRSRLEAGQTDVFRIEQPPKLSPFVEQHGFKDGITQFDMAMERWHESISRKLAESFELKKS